MNVFDLREAVVGEYARFTRSYSEVRTPDIRAYLEGAYAHGRFWPVPLIQLNPSFVADATVQELAGQGLLHEACQLCGNRHRNRVLRGGR